MKKGELRWILVYAAILACVTTLPYFIGYMVEGEEWRFTGFVIGVEDGNSYIAKMLRGSEGSWLFRSPYSSMEQRGVIAFLPYILLGKLASGPGMHEQLVALFHLFRIFVIPLTVYATYRFISLFVKDVYWRKIATILSTAGGGLGWLLAIFGKGLWFGSLPMDWISPEWFGFLAFLGIPHLILARALLLLGLSLYLTSPIKKARAWLAGMCFFGLGLVHPLGMVTAIAVLGVHLCVVWIIALIGHEKLAHKKWLRMAIRAVLPPLPLIIYYLIRFSTDPYLILWTKQNRIFSPHPLHILIAYGLVFIPAIIGVKKILDSRPWTGWAITGWLLAFPLFAYAPHNLQRRLPEGIWVAWTILAILGLEGIRKRWFTSPKILPVVFLGLSLPTSFILMVNAIQYSLHTSIPIFRPTAEVEVFQWLRDETAPDSVVLSSFSTGNAMPAWAPVRVVMGHGPETADIRFLESMVFDFYSGEMSDDEISAFIESQHISYVFLGPYETVPDGIDLKKSPFFQLRFQFGDYQIFEVQ
jgi:hypothetical protein